MCEPLDEGPIPPSVSHLSLGGPRALPGTCCAPGTLQATQRGLEGTHTGAASLHTTLGMGHVPASTRTPTMCTPVPTAHRLHGHVSRTLGVYPPSHQGCAFISSKIRLSTVLFPILRLLLLKCHYILSADALFFVSFAL